MTAWIQTYLGKAFDFESPTVDMVNIVDIAQSLSHLCRFTGHSRIFYSVAEHSVHMSRHLWARGGHDRERCRRLAQWGLLHDAVEAYVGDMASPLKSLLPEYRTIEHRIEAVVLAAFGITETKPKEVQEADRVFLMSEATALLGRPPRPWPTEASQVDARSLPNWEPPCWAPQVAMAEFLGDFGRLFPPAEGTSKGDL